MTEEEARIHTLIKFSTKDGVFDGKARLREFFKKAKNAQFNAPVDLLSDKQVRFYLRWYDLNY